MTLILEQFSGICKWTDSPFHLQLRESSKTPCQRPLAMTMVELVDHILIATHLSIARQHMTNRDLKYFDLEPVFLP
jgi:hypothetical protein